MSQFQELPNFIYLNSSIYDILKITSHTQLFSYVQFHKLKTINKNVNVCLKYMKADELYLSQSRYIWNHQGGYIWQFRVWERGDANYCLLLATGPRNLPAEFICTADMCWFGPRLVVIPHPVPLSGANPDSYLSTSWFYWVWLDRSVPISGSVFRAFLCMVAFRYSTANRNIFLLVRHYHLLMYWLPE